MIQITPEQVTPAIRALFERDVPTKFRLMAVLAGGNAGKIFVNDPVHPQWGFVRETDDGTLYLGGCVDRQILSEVISRLQKEGYVCLVYRNGDPDFDLFPPNPDDRVECLEFDRPVASKDLTPYLAQVPAGFSVQRMDRALLERSPRSEEYLSRYGSFETLLNHGIPVCVLHDSEPVCEAFADIQIGGVREIGIRTQKAYRLQGLATIACAYLIRLCDEDGSATYWDCVKANLGSVKLARKLGFQNERDYQALVFRPISCSIGG